jgi:predicted alpha-1,2-mannosidase
MTSGYTQYATFSGWDTYRSQAQLLAWLFPKEASDMMKSYLSAAEQCGAFPKWAERNNEANVMNGDPAAGIVAASYAFGAKDFDAAKALEYLKKTGDVPGTKCQHAVERPGLESYLKYGYIPNFEKGVWGPVATSLEYYVADYAVAQLAKALGDQETAERYTKRSLNWNLNFDKQTGLPRPRDAAGAWFAPFDPVSRDGFVEGNAYQYLWFVPHDARGLIDWLGGDEFAIRALDEHFSHTNGGADSRYFYIGNEPSFHTP